MKPRTLLGFLAVALLGVVAMRACPREPATEETGVTRELFGRWTTEDPRYADRFLDISATEIGFGQGEAGEARHRISHVLLERRDDGSHRYVVRYFFDDKREEELDLLVLAGHGELRLETLPEVRWVPDR
jgi:hypothetical protein